MSGLSLSMVAGRDANAALYQLDQVQELSLLRSELRRGFVCTANMSTSLSNIILPIRYVQISSGGARTTYAMKTRVGRDHVPSGLQHATRRAIQSKIKAFRSPIGNTYYNGTRNKSPIETFGMKTVQKQTFAGYMYLSNIDESVNNDPVFFYGYDEIWGRVHSNTDIWLKNFGGWPLFHDHVSTAGHIQYWNGSPNPDDVFLDGYSEYPDVGEIEFNPNALLIRRNGGVIWNEFDIAFVDLIDRDFEVMLATITEDPPDTLFIYNIYPPFGPVGDSINYNYIAFKDTAWTNGGGGSIEGGSKMVEAGELWISGTSGGESTWGSAGNMMLVDDILYTHTEKGDPPDGYGGGGVNTQDYLGLVSERQILIQYGLVDPRDTLRHHYNCDGNAEGIYIYAGMAALGDGEGDAHQDGIFSFEYQYPHRGTPNVTVGNEYFDYIDLHMCKYPPGDLPYWPWPARGGGGYHYGPLGDNAGPDYPWYNPLWPEWTPFKERGMIHIYGSVAQTRRGFVHRSGGDPLDTGWWQPDAYRYGPPPAFGMNAPGSDGSGVGYDKDYHYDYRFMDNPPPDFPEVNIIGSEGLFQGLTLRFQRPPRGF
ncbi:MAG: hypothetical protein K8R90_08995 [Candidatus Cloacimonetes bacterium]|nr:hypothetical protein [Candidatus Cloacimonadota bacterium]